MLIGFDASRAFIPEATGTENYSLNLLRVLAKIDRRNHYRVYLRNIKATDYRLRTSDWPSNFEFKIIRPSRFWTQLGLALETWRNPVDLLFIPAHTLPILRKRSIGFSIFQLPFSNYFKIFQLKNRKSMTNGRWQMGNRTKYVVTIHDLGVEYLPGYHQFPQRYYLDFASRYACRHAEAIIAVSQATKADIVKRYQIQPKRVFVVHEGVDERFFKPQSKVKVESVKSKYKIQGAYILFVGTVQPRKNLEMLIRAFVQVCRMVGKWDSRFENLQLIIAGKLGWDYEKILGAPKKYGVEDKVKFLDYVDRKDLPALYSGALAFAFPSLFEGFGLPILEALSCGCPVVVSDIPPHKEIFNKISGSGEEETKKRRDRVSSLPNKPMPIILVEPNDINRWTHVLYQSISQYNRCTGKLKTTTLQSKFSWEIAAKETLKIFNKMLG